MKRIPIINLEGDPYGDRDDRRKLKSQVIDLVEQGDRQKLKSKPPLEKDKKADCDDRRKLKPEVIDLVELGNRQNLRFEKDKKARGDPALSRPAAPLRSKRRASEDHNRGSKDPDVFELKERPPESGDTYHRWCLYFLSSEFPRATITCVRRVLSYYRKKLEPAYAALHDEYQRALAREQGNIVEKRQALVWLPSEGLRLNKLPRVPSEPPRRRCPVFDKELAAVKSKYKMQRQPPEQVVVEEDVECGCCFSEYPFEQVVQCTDGHLFCFGCLKRHVEEATFGGGQARTFLPCMDTAGCTEYFPWSEVVRALPADVLVKYENRLAEDSISRARLEGLVYCPFCNVPCEVDPGFRVLDCPNPTCRKSSCLNCKEPSHLPLQCHEVEKKSETSLRRRVEELMTKALIRECVACKAELVKLDGCNKITCRCGQVMCYLCRQAIRPDYTHFCQHPREPGKRCTRCQRCGLWEAEESDAVVRAAKEAAMHEAARQEPGIVHRKIGPEEHLHTNKRTKQHHPHIRNNIRHRLHRPHGF